MLAKIVGFIKEAQAYTKFIVAVVTGLLTIAAGFIPADWAQAAQAVILALGAFSVYRFPNVTPDGGIEYPDVKGDA